MKLTLDQTIALNNGEPVPLVLDRTECVVLRKDVYERIKRLLYDDSEWTAGEMLTLAERTFEDTDNASPIP